TVTAVAPAAGTPSGGVAFKEGATTMRRATLDSAGKATYTTSALSVATHSITAVYGGDGNFNATGVGGSTAPVLSQVVNKADSLKTGTSSGKRGGCGQRVTRTATITEVARGGRRPRETGSFTYVT